MTIQTGRVFWDRHPTVAVCTATIRGRVSIDVPLPVTTGRWLRA
jgi:hypothetical protein